MRIAYSLAMREDKSKQQMRTIAQYIAIVLTADGHA
jgi:hypothetical protein